MLKEDGSGEKESPSISGFDLVDQERLADQGEFPSDVGFDDDGLLLEDLDPGRFKEIRNNSPVQEESVLNQGLISSNESEGLGELRFADSD